MNLPKHSSIRRLLALFSALAALIVVVSLLPPAVVDWERLFDSREREIIGGYQYARATIQERLSAARLLAEQLARQPQLTTESAGKATILLLGADGALLSACGPVRLPRLASLAGRLHGGSATGVELGEQGELVAVGSAPSGGRLVVVALPFTLADAQTIKDATGLDNSLFAGRARVVTTLRDPSGQPVTAPLPAGEWDALLPRSGRLRWIPDPTAPGQFYLQIQVPLFGLDGAPVGAYAIGHSWSDYRRFLYQRLGLWAALVAAGAVLMLILTLWLRRRLLGPLGRLHREMTALVGSPAGKPLEDAYGLAELSALAEAASQIQAARVQLARNNQRLSEQLVQTQTLAALGQLAAGVAHDLNNPLTTIMGLADIIQTADVDADTQRDLSVIRRQAERSGHIVRGLLAFARRQRADPQWVSLNDLITQTLELLAYQARVSNIRFETHLDPDLPLTWADPSQLQQVLFNIINNGLQAVASAHGLGHLWAYSSWSPPSAGAPHGRITVRVQDDGPGIPDEILPRLFQPYFTTKEPGDGTGLGLAIAAGVVRRHSGRIWAENNPGGGASFCVELPVTPEPPQAICETPTAKSPSPVAESTRTILLADSDAQRVSALARSLRRRGRLLSTAGDGLLARSKMEIEEFDLVLCGLELSRLDGRELYAWAKNRRPQMADRFVFIISGRLSAELESFLESVQVLILRPPFQEDTVNAVVEQALNMAQKRSDSPTHNR